MFNTFWNSYTCLRYVCCINCKQLEKRGGLHKGYGILFIVCVFCALRPYDSPRKKCTEKLLWKMWISFQWNEAKDIRSNDFRLPLWISNVSFRWALRSKHWFLVCNAVLLNRIDTSVPIILKSIFWSEAVRLTAVVIKLRSRSGCIELIKTRSRAVCVYQEIYTKFIIPDSNQYSWRREEETSQVFAW